MRIFIEAGSFYGQRSGVGRYSLSLCDELIKLRPDDEFTLFSFLRPGRQLNNDFKLPKNASFEYIRWFPGRLFSLMMRSGLSLPFEIFGLGRPDLLIFPNFIAWASIAPKKRISVVHDLAFLTYPEFIGQKNLSYLKRQLPKSIKRSDKIVAVSKATKRDLVKHYNVMPEKIEVIYGAIDSSIFNAKAKNKTPAVKLKLGLPEKYLLFVGNLEPRKNITGLLQAYADSFASHGLPLVLVGAKGWNDKPIDEAFEKYKDLPIIRLGYADETDLAPIYAGASIFVYPSFHEGFGIPPLEAMACGCPVICSDTSSLPEAVGKAAVTIDPKNINKISKAISRLADDEKRRQELIAAGLLQSKKFSWQGSAQQLSKLIDSLAQG